MHEVSLASELIEFAIRIVGAAGLIAGIAIPTNYVRSFFTSTKPGGEA